MNNLIKKYNKKDIFFLLSRFLVLYVKGEIWGNNINQTEMDIINEYIISKGYDDNILSYINIEFLCEAIIENNSIDENIDDERLRIYLLNFIFKEKIQPFNSENYQIEVTCYSVEKLREKLEIYLKMENIPHSNNSIHIQKLNILTNEYKSKGGEVIKLFESNNRCLIM